MRYRAYIGLDYFQSVEFAFKDFALYDNLVFAASARLIAGAGLVAKSYRKRLADFDFKLVDVVLDVKFFQLFPGIQAFGFAVASLYQLEEQFNLDFVFATLLVLRFKYDKA